MSIVRLEARRRARQMANLAATHYRGAEQTRLRSDWILGESDPDTDIWERLTLVERAHDLARNDSVASGALDTVGDNVIGYGLRPQSRLNGDAVGFSVEQARAFQRQVESVFRNWSPYADVAGFLHFEDIQSLVVRQVLEVGESLVKRGFVDDEPWRPMGTAFECLEADQLAEGIGGGEDDSSTIRHGIRVGTRGQRLAYLFDKPDPETGAASGEPLEVPARDPKGRPNVFHLFHMKRPGQLRGYSFFAPAMTLFKDRADYLEAEVITRRVLACFGVIIESLDPFTAAEAGAMRGGEATTDAGGDRLEQIEPGFVHYLKQGEKVHSVDPQRAGSEYAAFMEHLLRAISTSLGIPYELLFKDFSKTNYSSARAALLEAWRFFIKMRKWIVRQFCQPVWELVLEEAYLRRLIHAPNFYDLKAEYCKAAWIGPGRGWVDPVKEVTAAVDKRKGLMTTLADEVAEQGGDWEEVLEQRARENDRMEQLGLAFDEPAESQGGQDAKPEEERE